MNDFDQNTIDTLEQQCPSCGYKFDCATCVSTSNGEKIVTKPGDVSICLQCAALNIFVDEQGTIRKATSEDIKRLMDDRRGWKKIETYIRAVKEIKRINSYIDGQRRKSS